MSELRDLQKRALEIKQKYDELNTQNGQSTWAGIEFMMGFTGDIGDLTKIIMAKENLRKINDVDIKLGHELADCLWSVLVLANQYNVDLETEFLKTMNELEAKISNES